MVSVVKKLSEDISFLDIVPVQKEKKKHESAPYREVRHVQYLADGYTMVEIGRMEERSHRTVETFFYKTHLKYGVKNTVALVSLFFRNGWIK